MTLSETWECPNCQTLNVAGTSCYSCGAVRPNAPDMQTDSAELAGFSAIPEPIPDWQPTDAIEPSVSAEVDLEPHPCWCHLVKGDHDIRDHPATSAADDESKADGRQTPVSINWRSASLD